MSKHTINLKNHFLIAMPGLADPTFSNAVVLICEHNADGALGLIVNRPLDMMIDALFENLKMPVSEDAFENEQVYLGGPVQTERGFVLHRPLGSWQATLSVTEDIGLTTSRDILESVASGELPPSEWLIALGHSGWTPGQLENEIGENAWLTVAADYDIIFDLPADKRFEAAIGLLVPHVASLSPTAGHA